jgi:hypothetical protein
MFLHLDPVGNWRWLWAIMRTLRVSALDMTMVASSSIGGGRPVE